MMRNAIYIIYTLLVLALLVVYTIIPTEDAVFKEEQAVQQEEFKIICKFQRHEIKNIKFDYDMEATCISILNGEEVL